MDTVELTIFIDDEKWEQDFPDAQEVELECEMHYEPADPSVGYNFPSIEMERVTRDDTGEQFSWSDLKNWDRIEEQAVDRFQELMEQRETEAAIEAYENRKAYNGW